MSVNACLGRFFLTYITLTVGSGILLSLLRVELSSVTNLVLALILLLTAVWRACSLFGHKNHRYFTRVERRKVWLGMIAVNVAVHFLLLFSSMLLAGRWNAELQAEATMRLVATSAICVLHVPFIWGVIVWIGKQFPNQPTASPTLSA